MMDLVIVRSEWLRGESYRNSKLYRSSDNKKCCLGFYGIACGHTIEELKDISDPIEIQEKGNWKGANVTQHMGTYGNLMGANDKSEWSVEVITDEERELRITKYFKEIGVNVTFTD